MEGEQLLDVRAVEVTDVEGEGHRLRL
jgi:hypothetical protein